MTTDKLTNALVALLDPIKPDASSPSLTPAPLRTLTCRPSRLTLASQSGIRSHSQA
jgi:hypothetical protein